jgi:hypothetical protein
VTFEAPGFVVLTIPPQIAVADLEAEELPSYHRNIDMDEVMLSHADEDPAGRRPGSFRHIPYLPRLAFDPKGASRPRRRRS